MQVEWFDAAASSALCEPNAPLIEGIFDEGAMSVIYGDSNSGKTFVALDMAFRVATGIHWNERPVKHGLVVYVAAEGGSRIKRRIAALSVEHGDLQSRPLFALIRFPIDLRSGDADLNGLLSAIRGAEKECDDSCTWIIVDTLSRAMAGGDENSPVDMGRVVNAADRLRDETSAHFTFVHHSGKDSARGARGHSLLRAATDTELEVANNALTATKQRDMETGLSLGFRLIDTVIGTDASGRELTSAVVEWTGHGQRDTAPKSIAVPPASRLLISVVKAAIEEAGESIKPFADGPMVKAAPDATIRNRYYARMAESSNDGEDASTRAARIRQAYHRAINTALERELLIAATYLGQRWVWLP